MVRGGRLWTTEEIAAARTFCLRREAEMLQAAGLGKGANLDNTVVIGDDGTMPGELRFSDEPARRLRARLSSGAASAHWASRLSICESSVRTVEPPALG